MNIIYKELTKIIIRFLQKFVKIIKSIIENAFMSIFFHLEEWPNTLLSRIPVIAYYCVLEHKLYGIVGNVSMFGKLGTHISY